MPQEAGVSKYDWPDLEEFVKIYVEGGCSYGAIAAVVNCPLGTISSYIHAHPELRARLKEAKRAQKVSRKEPPPRVGEAVDDREILEHELKEARRALARARGEEVATERVLGKLTAGIEAAKPTYTPTKRHKSDKQEAHTLVLMLSDLHAGEKVSLVETNGLNEYNWQVMLERLGRLAESVRSHRDHYGSQARHLRIYGLGDGLSGSIHDELRETNEFPLAECCIRLGEDRGRWIATEFGDEFETIKFDGVVGNHPRFSQKPRAKVAYDNGDWIADETTRLYLRNYDHIVVRAHKAKQAIVETCGETHALIHGDGVRTTMAGVPWGGIIRHSDKLRKLFELTDVPVRRVFGGHWHNPQIAENWTIFINGSVKGIDEYSISTYGDGKPAGQILVAMHPKWGLTAAHKIDLQTTSC